MLVIQCHGFDFSVRTVTDGKLLLLQTGRCVSLQSVCVRPGSPGLFFVLINCSEVDLEWCGRAVYRELRLAHSQIPDKPDHIWHFDFFLTLHADDVLLSMSESNLSFSKRKHISLCEHTHII